jgi:hypothetical protein
LGAAANATHLFLRLGFKPAGAKAEGYGPAQDGAAANDQPVAEAVPIGIAQEAEDYLSQHLLCILLVHFRVVWC